MAYEQIAQMIKENDKRNQDRINAEIDKYHMAYKIKDSDGNVFCWGGVAKGGLPWYRGIGGSKHIFDLTGYEVIEKYVNLVD